MKNIPILVTILPILGIPEFVQVRIKGEYIDLCIEGTKTDALTVAFEELLADNHAPTIKKIYDYTV